MSPAGFGCICARLNHTLPAWQGEIFAADGFGKVTGEVGVCIATSGPGATNLVTGLADALLDSVPLVAITGQVRPCSMRPTAREASARVSRIVRQEAQTMPLVLSGQQTQ